MNIAKVFKSIINKLHKSSKPELPEWAAQYIKTPVHTEIVAAQIALSETDREHVTDDYIKRKLASLIAGELVNTELIKVEQASTDRPSVRIYTGKVEIVLRG